MIVGNATGITAGSMYRIYDGDKSETIYVASNYVYGSTTVPLVAPLVFSHAAGVTFGNLPTAIKQAAILVTTAFLKARGDNSLTMNITYTPTTNIEAAQRYGGDIAMALEMVSLYRRVR